MKVVNIGNIADAFRFDDLPATGIVIEATPDELERLPNLAYKDIEVSATPRRNCDKFRDVDAAYNQFMSHVMRENPACTKPSPLHTVWDALKWVLADCDGRRSE